ncbi:SAM-dependent methyltransferase [Sphaerisporangium rubeum]|uniref:O-methyltransferase involved in polyketide biosynthesis n=1 Tax=Sphaerisporangium rubeum TaxID=321317 RepID=A0A7X0IDH3_9ACTN|nr:O-methyltransferase involved in polyketide biosynthesis [Sphaerisporangium rubeum]
MSESTPTSGPQQPTKIDPTVAHSARVWNHWLGGKDNFAADRQVGDQILKVMPALVDSARADRAFLGRAVRHLTAEAGLRQFLDIGTGLPTASNTHEVAQSVAPECRVVYVDNDPIVLTHARALLVGTPEGATDYIEADIRDTTTVLDRARETLDFTEPVALMLLGVLNFIPDDAEAAAIIRRLLDAVPSGSHLAVAHPTAEVHAEAMHEAVRQWNAAGSAPMVLRSPTQISRWFDGLDLLEPGVVSCSQWRAEPDDFDAQEQVSQFCAVGRKP